MAVRPKETEGHIGGTTTHALGLTDAPKEALREADVKIKESYEPNWDGSLFDTDDNTAQQVYPLEGL